MKQTLSDHIVLAIWAAECAEHVLPFFEVHCPLDNRPRQAVDAARFWINGELGVAAARKAAFAAHAAARAAIDPKAVASARAAAHAAATAHVPTHAPHAARYALKACTLVPGWEAEEAWQQLRLPVHLRRSDQSRLTGA